MILPEYLTVREAAARLGCSKHYINQYIKQRRLTPCILSASTAQNAKRYVKRTDLETLIQELDAEARRTADHARAKKHVAALREKRRLFGRDA